MNDLESREFNGLLENQSFENELIEHLPFLEDVHMESIVLDRPFEQMAASFAQDSGTVLLLSGSLR